ncbi:MAG: hypothetical protein VX745_02175 [Pseudomonadota bacterium]|nr:hypothetical protein [Pseudomonadota bacterium]
MPEFKEREADRLATKEKKLAPYIKAAMERKQYMKPMSDEQIPNFLHLDAQL